MNMQFCPKCGSILIPKKEGGKAVLVCPKCGLKLEPQGNVRVRISKKLEHKETEKMYILDTDEIFKGVPKATGVKCPKCGHDEAYYTIIQTRRADEPPTRIYKCTKCGHVWREYE